MKILIGIISGAILGFIIGYFGKCTSGVCPLTSDPITAAIIFAFLGGIISLLR